MKKLTLTLILLVLAIIVNAQPLGPGYVVYFTDKDNSPYSIDNPSEFLTAAALDRRARQGIPVEIDDLPVNSNYLSGIVSAGAQVAMVSRWFNAAGVWIQNPANVAAIAALPFVSEVVPMSGNKQAARKLYGDFNKPFFSKEEYDLPVSSAKHLQNTNNFYDYGAALTQIEMLCGQYLHNAGYRGDGMVIAVLDAGFRNVDIISAFDSLRANNRILGTRDFVQPGNNVYDPMIHPHGTMVLSIMAANLPGLMVGTAPEASYWLLRTEDANGPPNNSEYLMEEYYWIAGAEFADSVGAWVINSSLGYYEFDDPTQNHTYADLDGNTIPITLGADRAASKGILVVNSAGNSGASPWQYIIAPSDGFNVVSIAAVDSNGNRVGFSSIGPSADGRTKPDLAAQGGGTTIVGSNGNVGAGNGTSFSSPIIAGLAACLWQTNIDVGNMQVYEAMIQSGSQYMNPDNLLGYGLPDFEQAQLMLTSDKHLTTDKHTIKVYPNPASSFLTIETSQENPIFQISLSDLAGKTRFFSNYGTSPQMVLNEDISDLNTGIYILRIYSAKGTEARRIVKF